MKETMLTVLVPIQDSDATQVTTLPAVSPSNINVIYKHNGVYKRVWLNPATNQYEYHEVTDREFPYLGKPLEIFDFTYDANRMGTAPTITAQNVMWFDESGEGGSTETLDDLWTAHSNDCHVSFGGENFYLRQVPTSSKSNEDARYRYDIDFISERFVLEHVYLYDVVQPFITEKPITESSVFSFFGNIDEFIKRINSSLIKSGLCQVEVRTPPLSYAAWNELGIDSPDQPPYSTYNGDYTSYLYGEILVLDEHGEIVTTGYKVVVDENHEENENYTKEILLTFDNNTIHEALQKIRDEYGLMYYYKKNGNGDTIVHVGEYDYNFGENNPFQYGVDNELMQIEKTNKTKEIITSVTGIGGETNIPWFYPNPTPDGWLAAEYLREGEVIQDAVIYPTDESSQLYERFLKNRVGKDFVFGSAPSTILTQQSTPFAALLVDNGSRAYLRLFFSFEPTDPDDYYIVNIQRNRYLRNVNNCRMSGYSARIDSGGTIIPIGSAFANDKDDNGQYLNLNDGITLDEYTWLHRSISVAFDYDNDPLYSDTKFGLYVEVDVKRSSLLVSEEPWYYYPERKITLKCNGVFWYNNAPQVKELCVRIPAFFCKEKLTFVVEDAWDTEGIYYVDETGRKFSEGDDFDKIEVPDEKKNWIARWGAYAENNMPEDYLYNWSPDVHASEFLGACPRWVWRLMERKHSGYLSSALGVYTDGSEWSYNGQQISWYNFKGTRTSNTLTAYQVFEKVRPFKMTVQKLSKSWVLNNKKTNLLQYGLSLQNGIMPAIGDIIRFRSVKYLTPQKNLMPQLYVKSDGARRFYPAHNYDPVRGLQSDVDSEIGETWQQEAWTPSGEHIPAGIINSLYYNPDENNDHYDFENEYFSNRFFEHIEKFDDIYPTIKEQRNNNLRIDVVETFAYDEFDDDTLWVDENGQTSEGEYKHPHFFAKLRPLGFNLFDLALQEDMTISLTTGHCGGCVFKIKVDENTKKNPVQIWPHDVGTFAEGAPHRDVNFNIIAHEGELIRYGKYEDCYYKIGADNYIKTESFGVSNGFLVYDTINNTLTRYSDVAFDEEDLRNGYVGNTTSKHNIHIEGDVVTRGRFIDSQQDTTSNYVWVALEKDVQTYGTIMPSSVINYNDPQLSDTIRPLSISDVHTSGSTPAQDEEAADKFVLLNIRMPQAYMRRAEEKLSKAAIKYMFDNNYQKYAFDIKFSRIFWAQESDSFEHLNEASLLYLLFNNRKYKQYAFAYSYRMTKGELPEITVNLDDDRNLVYRTAPSSGSGQDEPVLPFDTNITKNGSQETSGAQDSEIESLKASVTKLSRYISSKLLKKTDVEITDDRNIRVGNTIVTPVYMDDEVLVKTDFEKVGDAVLPTKKQIINPASINGTSRSMHDKKTLYTLLDTEPDGWEENYSNYFIKQSGIYSHVAPVPLYAPGFDDADVYEYNYVAMSREPADWENNWSQYYLRDNDSYIPLSSLGYMDFEENVFFKKQFSIVQEKPEDWDRNWGDYYYKLDDVDVYQPITGLSYPPFTMNTYYEKEIVNHNNILPIEVLDTPDAVHTPTTENLARQSDVNIIKTTVEQRFIDFSLARRQRETCSGETKWVTTASIRGYSNDVLFWLSSNGQNVEYAGDDRCYDDPFKRE